MALPGDSRVWYTGLIALVALARLAELALARRNALRLKARGGVESGAGHYPLLVAVHAGALAGAPLEVWLLNRPFLPWLAAAMCALLAVTFALRYWVIATLGERWTTRVIVLPGAAPIATGPFRWLNHPNYLAVVFEVPALALVHTAWLSALVCGVLNAAVLRHRIRIEDSALGRAG